VQVRSLVCASPQASKPLVTESGLQTSSPAAPHADLHFLTVRIMIKAHSGHTEMRGKRLVKAARPGRSRRRHGGLAYAPAAAPAPAGPYAGRAGAKRSSRAAARRGKFAAVAADLTRVPRGGSIGLNAGRPEASPIANKRTSRRPLSNPPLRPSTAAGQTLHMTLSPAHASSLRALTRTTLAVLAGAMSFDKALAGRRHGQ